MRPPRVLLLTRDMPFHGGVPQVLLTYARHYDPRRLELHIASFRAGPPEMTDAISATGAKLHVIGDRGYAEPILTLRKIISRESIDVVIACTFKPYLVAKIAARLRPCKVMFWMHGILLLISGGLRTSIFRWAARNDTLVFVSESTRRFHAYAGHRGRQFVVLNGIADFTASDSPYDRSKRNELGIPDSALVVGYTAEFIGWKQHRTLLAAFAKAATELPQLHLVLIGTGELWDSTREQARRMPHMERIHFLGARKDARRLLGIMDIYAHPSNGEGLSIAVAEAMLARSAMIVADNGSLLEMIDDGLSGVVFRTGDADELAGKIVALAKDPKLRRRLGEAARQTALTRFSPEHFAEHLTTVLEEEVIVPHTAALACDKVR